MAKVGLLARRFGSVRPMNGSSGESEISALIKRAEGVLGVRVLRTELSEELAQFVVGGRWTHVYPYMLFCQLEGVDIEASIAAALGYLEHVKATDKQHKVKRASLKGLRLPQKPKVK